MFVLRFLKQAHLRVRCFDGIGIITARKIIVTSLQFVPYGKAINPPPNTSQIKKHDSFVRKCIDRIAFNAREFSEF